MNYSSLANRFLCDIPVYEPGRPIEDVAREHGLNPNQIVKLASNENALGPSPRAIQAMRRLAPVAHLYPDGGAFHLRHALAKQLGVGPENLIFGNGSNEVIEFLFHAFVEPGNEVVVGDRAFIIYKFMSKMFQARCVEVPFRGHTHDLDAMREAVSARTKLVFVANPNNPTGTRVSHAALDRFVRSMPERVIVALDEAYYEYLERPPLSVAHALRRNVVVLRTFSKIVGLAGLRIGYGVAHRDAVALMERVRQPFNANAMAQAAALAALGDRAHIRRTLQMTRRGLTYLYDAFGRLGLEHVRSSANFVLVNVGDGDRVFRSLQKQGVIVRPMRAYKMPEWVRVTVGLPEENHRLANALKRCLAAEC